MIEKQNPLTTKFFFFLKKHSPTLFQSSDVSMLSQPRICLYFARAPSTSPRDWKKNHLFNAIFPREISKRAEFFGDFLKKRKKHIQIRLISSYMRKNMVRFRYAPLNTLFFLLHCFHFQVKTTMMVLWFACFLSSSSQSIITIIHYFSSSLVFEEWKWSENGKTMERCLRQAVTLSFLGKMDANV